MSSHLQLDENFEGSLQNSEYSEADSEVAQINLKANKNRQNKNQKDDDADDIEEHIDEEIPEIEDVEDEEEIDEDGIIPKPKRSKSPQQSVQCNYNTRIKR